MFFGARIRWIRVIFYVLQGWVVGERRPGEILVFTKVLQEDRVSVGTKKRVNKEGVLLNLTRKEKTNEYQVF